MRAKLQISNEVCLRDCDNFRAKFDKALAIQTHLHQDVAAKLQQANIEYTRALRQSFDEDSPDSGEYLAIATETLRQAQRQHAKVLAEVRDTLRTAILSGYGFDIAEPSLSFVFNNEPAPSTFAVLSAYALPSKTGARNILVNCVTAKQTSFSFTLGIDVLQHAVPEPLAA